MASKQPFLVRDGIESLVNKHPLAELFEPLSIGQAVRMLGTDRAINQHVVDIYGKVVMILCKTSSDILEVRERVKQPLIAWGEEPARWNVTRYVYLGEREDGSLNLRVEEYNTN